MPTTTSSAKIKKTQTHTGTERVRKIPGVKVSSLRTRKIGPKKVTSEKASKKEEAKENKTPVKGFYRAVGRRKEATARVRMTEKGTGIITVNTRPFEKYFPLIIMRDEITAPLKLVGQFDNHDYSIKVEGGGTQGQAGAVRHGLARVLLQWNAEFRPPLKKAGFLRRDPRAKERKKFGLKGARRAPQWAKR